MVVGKRMRTRRKELGYRQEDLARIMDLPQSLISQYETGKRHPLPDMLNKIADALKASADYLIGRSPIPESNLDQLSSEERDIIARLRSLASKPTAKKAAIDSLMGQGVEKNAFLRARRKRKK